MIGLFRVTTVGYIINMLVGLTWLFILNWLFLTRPLLYLFALIWFAVCFWTFFVMSRKKLKKITALWIDTCDVAGFVAFFEKFAAMRQYRSMKNYVFLSLANGYLALGNNAGVIEALGKVGNIPKNKVRLINQFSYERIWCAYHLRIKDFSAAEIALGVMQQVLEDPKWKAKQKQTYTKIFTEMQCLFRMERGDFSGAEAVFRQALEQAETKWEQVLTKFTLSKIYLHEQRTDAAIEALTFVAAEGGSSIYRQQALEQLEALGKPLPTPQIVHPTVTVFAPREKALLYSLWGALVLISAILIALIVPGRLEADRIEQFVPTKAEAFANHPAGYDDFGAVYFTITHENALAVLHSRGNTPYLHLSFFLTETIDGEELYFCLNTGGVGPWVNTRLDPDAEEHFMSIGALQEAIADKARWSFRDQDRVLGGRPLYGIANSANVRHLRINGQLVDHVIELGPFDDGSTLFFWYFYDAQVLYESGILPDEVRLRLS